MTGRSGIQRIRRRLFEILEISAMDDKVSSIFDAFIITMIVLNVALVVFETSEPLFSQYKTVFHAFDLFTIGVFTIEYLARIWVSDMHGHYPRNKPWRARLRYIVSPYALIDLVAILPFYLGLYWDLRILRLFRLVRLLKLFRYSPALATLGRVFYSERRGLLAAGIIMVGLMVVAATIIYYLEHDAQPAVFASIPHAMWWAVATLTTVGYGDMTPITTEGRMFGGFMMICGLGMFALPVGILASGFATEIRQREFVVNKDVLGQIPVFSSLGPLPLSRIASLLKARIFNVSDVITRAGDYADSMFIVLSGEVEVATEYQRVRMTSGEFFGELGLLVDKERNFTATARSRCQLMMLQKADFLHLIGQSPDIGRVILEQASARLGAVGADGEALLDEEEIARSRRAIDRALNQLG
ncbi:cyclic nucleotide-gated ion channel [Emcibacter sp. SYSU 3D8]|uniref:cyclic nucleotide-gated ion channel n=1 Tax=Emcibacter sp. SYSU 3D8 TaxID=3133969 RepID=UPI0031FEF51A